MDQFDFFRLGNLGAIGLSAFICVIFLPAWKRTFWKWLPLYFLVVFVAELTGRYLRLHPVSWISNPDYYSFFVHPVSFSFIFLGLSKNENGKTNSRLLIFVLILYAIACIIDYLFLKSKRFWFGSFSYTIGDLLVIMMAVRFYSRYLFSERIIHYKRDFMFWCITIWVIYYAGTFPYFALRNVLFDNHRAIFYTYWYIQISMSMLMYLSISFLYIWQRRK
ncbi:MAG: hypothetical protein NTW29_04305 [Bacteroidetes bacterium]|nr:hypothetical protein [Bacteroidota bacterium]